MQLYIPGTQDLLAIQLTDEFSKLTIYDLYSDCHNSDTINPLGLHLNASARGPRAAGTAHEIWCGDFNCHHPMWDEDRNHHLFTSRALEDASKLLALVADHSMYMALPKGIPTLESMVTKNWTRPDNAFCSGNLIDKLVYCTTDLRLCRPSTDHVPISDSPGVPACKGP